MSVPKKESLGRREKIALAIVETLPAFGWQYRKRLLQWVRQTEKKRHFDLATLRRWGLIRPQQVSAQKRLAMIDVALAKAQLVAAFAELSLDDLERLSVVLPYVRLNQRYGSPIPRQVLLAAFGSETLPKDCERRIEPLKLRKKETERWLAASKERVAALNNRAKRLAQVKKALSQRRPKSARAKTLEWLAAMHKTCDRLTSASTNARSDFGQ